MKKTLLALAASAAFSAPAFATVIDFESTGSRADYNDLDYAIDGFLFNATMDNIDVGANGPWEVNGPAHGGSYAALNNYGGYGEITRADGAAFTFHGLWIKNWYHQGDAQGSIVGYRNGAVVGAVDLISRSGAWTEVTATFTDIDALRIDLAAIFLIDDIALDQAAHDVPEPTSLALFGLGVAGLLSARRTLRKA